MHVALGIPRETLDGAPPAEQFDKVIIVHKVLDKADASRGCFELDLLNTTDFEWQKQLTVQ